MKKLIISVLALCSFTSFAGLSIDTSERLITVYDESGAPVKGAVIEVQASYDKCTRIYWGVGNPCQFKSLFHKYLRTDEDGMATIPAIKKYIPNGINSKNKDISFSFSIDKVTTKELETKYSSCGYQLHYHLKSKPLSSNLKDYIKDSGYASSCSYYVRDENKIDDELTGQVECELTGTRDLGFVNGKRTHVEIPLKEAIEDYKKLCK